MVRVHRATTTEQWEAAGVVLSEYVQWTRATAGFDPLVEQSADAAPADVAERPLEPANRQ